MTIPKVTGYAGVIPDRRTQSAEDFTSAAVTWTDYQASSLIPDMNNAIGGINLAEESINESVQAVEEASFIAQGAANYQGAWFSGAAVDKGEAWSHNNTLWVSNVDGAGEPGEGADWVSINQAKNILLEDGDNVENQSTQSRQAIIAAYKAQGYNDVFFFKDGFTYVEPNDIGVYEDGTAWLYSDASALPVVVAAGTVPNDGIYSRASQYGGGSVFLDLQAVSESIVKIGDSVSWALNDRNKPSLKNGGKGIIVATPASPTSEYINIGNGRSIFVSSFYGPMEILTPVEATQDHMLFRNRGENQPSRIHYEPNGFFSGTQAKTDWMFDPYDLTPTREGFQKDYRIFNIYTKAGDVAGLNGESGAAVINVKSVGDFWGNWPSMHFSVSDDSATAMKLHYFDTSDTEWRTPFVGRWIGNTEFNSGDYVTCDNKIYKCLTTGTSGNLRLTHSSGTFTDGNLNWQWIRSPLDSAASIQPCITFGNNSDMPIFGHPGARAQFLRDTVTKSGAKHHYLNGSGESVGFFSSNPTTGVTRYESAAGNLIEFGSNFMKLTGSTMRYNRKEITLTNATIDFTGTDTVAVTSSIIRNVTSFSGLTPDSELKLIPRDGNVTLIHSSSLRLPGGADLNLSLNSYYSFYVDSDGTVRMIGGVL